MSIATSAPTRDERHKRFRLARGRMLRAWADWIALDASAEDAESECRDMLSAMRQMQDIQERPPR